MRQMLDRISLNGQSRHLNEGMISVLDRGYLFGEGVFTTLKVRDGVPLFLERHMERLNSNASEIGLISPAKIDKSIFAVIKENSLENGGVRVTITGGNSLDETRGATILVYGLKVASQAKKVDAITVSDMRDMFRTIKTTYRVPHLFALNKARESHCDDALFSVNGKLVESTYANIFAYTLDKKIVTPTIAGRGLNGITRQILMERLRVTEEEVFADTKASLMLVNSLGLRSVASINGRKLKPDEEFEDLIGRTMEAAEDEYIRDK